MAVSAKAFPILDISGEIDEYPLIDPVPLQWFKKEIGDDSARIQKQLTASFIPWLMSILISIVIGAKLAGIWGVLLAVPLASILMELAEDVRKRKSHVG